MPSGQPSAPEILDGPVAICLDRPTLSLDRPFTYLLDASLGAGVGSYVRVRFHGALSKGWVLGPTDDVPDAIVAVQKVVSPVRFFDAEMLELARWVSARYVAPLAVVLDRLSPPRVAGEEPAAAGRGPGRSPRDVPPTGPMVPAVLADYAGGAQLLAAARRGDGSFALRAPPADETSAAVEAVAACLGGGRRALVLVPEASPLPATASALLEAFGDRVVVFAGGDRRSRYRTWLEIHDGAADVVVGTRPAVYAPLTGLGLVYVSRESHPGHREERAPSTHVRDLALARATRSGATLVLHAACPSAETAAMGIRAVTPPRGRWPKVEVVRPGREGRAPRLVEALRTTTRGFLFSPLRGYGLAQVCRSCGALAACASCGGALREEAGAIRCVVCAAVGVCGGCGGRAFGVRRGGAERVAEWAATFAPVPVRETTRPRLPRAREIVVGGPEDVRDLGPGGLDLVAILDADLASRRPGLASRERALATWMEVVGWAAPAGRGIVQSSDPADPAIQAVVRGNADRFHERERARRADAGFPVCAPVFRVVGDERIVPAIAACEPLTTLVTSLGDRTVCLLALEPAGVDAFGAAMRALARRGAVERIEAEPHL